MNPERLLKLFDRVADAPDAVAKLQRLILDLAVRGKLVPQYLSESPAKVFLDDVREQQKQLISREKGRSQIFSKPVSKGEQPFSNPSGWEWVRLGDAILSNIGGGTPSKDNSRYWGGNIPWASVKDIGKSKYLTSTIDTITEEGLRNSSSNLIPEGNVIVVTRMGLGKVCINKISVAINQDLRALILPKGSCADFYYLALLNMKLVGKGLTVKGIKQKELLNICFPLPPLAEQHRIVQRVSELMALCDHLEVAQKTRQQTASRLLDALIAEALSDSPDPETVEVETQLALSD